MDIKLNDVYRFRYKIYKAWCFDGKLIVRKDKNGNLYLQDTYWGFNSNENKSFTLEQALEEGYLTFLCNLDEVEECTVFDLDYYADEDLFNLSYQHGFYKLYYKRKGAVKSPEKMKNVLMQKIKSTEEDIEWSQGRLKRLKEKLEKLNSGDVDICI